MKKIYLIFMIITACSQAPQQVGDNIIIQSAQHSTVFITKDRVITVTDSSFYVKDADWVHYDKVQVFNKPQ